MHKTIHHALVLNLHQPWGNLDAMLRDPAAGVARQGMPLRLRPHSARGVGVGGCGPRVHCAMSGSLLEALADPHFQARVYGIVKCGDVLWNLRNPALDILGTGYYHPVLPLIPAADREEHVQRWLGLARHLFARGNFSGFWPPECGLQHGDDSHPPAGRLPLCHRGQRAHRAHDAHALGGVALPPAHREIRRQTKSWSSRATATCPSPRRAAWRWAGSARTERALQVVRFRAAGLHRDRRGKRGLVPQHPLGIQLLGRLLSSLPAPGAPRADQRAPHLHPRLSGSPRCARPGHRAHRRLEHRLSITAWVSCSGPAPRCSAMRGPVWATSARPCTRRAPKPGPAPATPNSGAAWTRRGGACCARRPVAISSGANRG
jgi:hypothetical protein